MEWKKASIKIPVENLGNAAEAFVRGGEALSTVIDASAVAIRLMAALQSFTGGAGAAIDATLQAAEDLIPSDLLRPNAQASAYLLDIPLINPRRTRPLPPQIESGTLEDILLATNIRAPGDNVIGAGGNYGIYKKIVESVFDPRDPSKPVLGANCEIGVVIVVYGASTYIPAVKIAMGLEALLGTSLSLPTDVYDSLPVPQNVKATPVAKPGCIDEIEVQTINVGDSPGDGPHALKIRWDKASMLTRMLSEGVIIIDTYHVYAKAGSPIEAGEDLSQYEIQVVDLPKFSNVGIGSAVLRDVDSSTLITGLDTDITYYISVAFGIRLTVAGERFRVEDVEDLSAIPPSHSRLSEQVRVRLKEQVAPSAFTPGTPPDWHAVQSPLLVFPALAAGYEYLEGTLQVARDNFTDSVNEVSTLLASSSDQLQELIEQARQMAEMVQNIGRQLAEIAALDGEEAGLWGTGFSGKGGKALFTKKVGDALLGSTSKNRPPFDQGDEPVGALVFVVEGRSPVAVNTLLGPIKSLFSIGDEDGVDSPSVIEDLSDNPLADAGVSNVDAEGSIESTEQALSPETLGFFNESDEGDSAPSLHDLDIDDDPC